jgi:hypothetical protein
VTYEHNFQRGDHLAIRRPPLYVHSHHAVYVSDDCVYQLGGGIRDKPKATFGKATLEDLMRSGGTPRRVEHPSHAWWGPELPAAVSPEEIVRRAEFLEIEYTPERYNLVGNNCEHAANWCVTGWYSESHQVRSVWAAKAFVGGPIMFAELRRNDRSKALPWVVAASTAFTFVTIPMYNRHIRRFWQDIVLKWDAYDAAHPNE